MEKRVRLVGMVRLWGGGKGGRGRGGSKGGCGLSISAEWRDVVL
jgi:hypothetical protein